MKEIQNEIWRACKKYMKDFDEDSLKANLKDIFIKNPIFGEKALEDSPIYYLFEDCYFGEDEDEYPVCTIADEAWNEVFSKSK